MHVLRRVRPSPEQIGIVRRILSGVSLIRGAAGSGKTTTAMLALRAATGATVNQLRTDGMLPANVLVLTFNRTLRSYIETIARDEMADYANDVRLFISTFDKWALDTLGWTRLNRFGDAQRRLESLARGFPRSVAFTVDEAEYLLGRFPPDRLGDYIRAERTGRGASPTMPATVRQRLLDEVVEPYRTWKHTSGAQDFTDLSNAMMARNPEFLYDVIVVDEAQDMSSNQLRAVMRHAAGTATVTIVTDSTQRIYPRGTRWIEAGIIVAPNRSFRLQQNYRNTRQIASLAAAIAQGLGVDEDGSLPDPAACSRDGPRPILIVGRFRRQVEFVLDRLRAIDLTRETVGFLHLKGGGYFDYIRSALASAGYGYCELQGTSMWPENENIGLSTFHSAKGLEFDHVVAIGLAVSHAAYGDEPGDDRYDSHRRLLAMGVGRARQSVVLGTKADEALPILAAVDRSVIDEVIL